MLGRKFCGLSTPSNLDELAVVLDNTDLAFRLLQLYGTPDNIDVWMGGVAEPFVHGGRVGPLFTCLIATQFQRIRQGDRLWYENPGVFTSAQRNALRNASLALIICDNTGITAVSRDPFSIPGEGTHPSTATRSRNETLEPGRRALLWPIRSSRMRSRIRSRQNRTTRSDVM
ncbi:unnamed protein product [Coregonus sp. 'balchen']|nr:unnamed protein product [Coregonus sp. 'balchen']